MLVMKIEKVYTIAAGQMTCGSSRDLAIVDIGAASLGAGQYTFAPNLSNKGPPKAFPPSKKKTCKDPIQEISEGVLFES